MVAAGERGEADFFSFMIVVMRWIAARDETKPEIVRGEMRTRRAGRKENE